MWGAQELQEAPVDTDRETLLADKNKDSRWAFAVCSDVRSTGGAALRRSADHEGEVGSQWQ